MLVGAGEAEPAAPAGQERFDRDPVAGAEPPALGRARADLVDHAHRLVAGDERVLDADRRVELPPVLLDVGTADAAGLDAQECVVVTDARPGQLDQLERTGTGLDRRDDGFAHRVQATRTRQAAGPSDLTAVEGVRCRAG